MGTRKKMAIGGGTIGPGVGVMPMGQMPNPMPGTLTPEQYQQQFVDYYSFPGIGVEAAPEVDDEEKDDEPVRPDILTPVGQRGEQVANVFGQIPLYGTGQQFGTEDYNSYIENFDKQQKSDLSGKGFNRYLEQAAGIPGTVATVATGLPISALAYGAGQLARKEHRKNAAAIQAVDGMAGDMFKFNGQTVSRAPGSKFFTGNLGGLSQGDLYRSREIAKGFIPGTMQERAGIARGAGPQGMPGATGLRGVTRIEGAMMDAFGAVHAGQRDESGHMMVSATQAQRLREQEFRDMASLANIDISGLKGADFVNAAVAFKQHVDGVMKTDPSYGGFFHKTSNLSQAANNSALDRRRGTAVDFLKDKYGITTVADQPDEVIVPDAATQAQTSPSSSDDGDAPTGGTQYSVTRDDPTYSSSAVDAQVYGGSDDSGGGGGGGNSYSVGGGGRPSGGDSFTGAGPGGFFGLNRGGRVGMQAGGVAAQPAGFVGGPPENFTDGQTVADDQPMSVPEGTFVINAAAVEFAGSDDIKKMLSDAYGKMQKKVDKTIAVAKIPTEDEIDVAVSRGEVIVPPEVAKIIGYDRLEKINNRGKKEVTRRQEAAGGGFLDGKKFAEGGETSKTLPERKPKKEALADVELRADLEEFIKDDNLARLGFSLYESGDLKLIGMPLRRGTTGATIGGQYFPKQGEDEYPVYPSGVSKVETAARAAPLFKQRASDAGFVMDPKEPTAVYFSESMPHFNADRASVFITLAHELRHAALNHLANEYGAPQQTLSTEERVMDFYDEKARREASKKNKSVNRKFSPESLDVDKTSARQIPKYAKMHDMYEEMAGLVLKERGYPERAVKKGRLKRFIDSFLK